MTRMHRLVAIIACSLLTFIPLGARGEAVPSPHASAGSASPSPLAGLEWLVGGTWVADASTLPVGLKQIQTRYETVADGKLMRFTTEFVSTGGQVVNRYAGNLYYDTARKQLAIWYIDSRNEITQGTVSGAGDHWAVDFQAPGGIIGVAGPVDFKADIAHSSPTAYQWTLSADLQGTWKQLFSLTYAKPVDPK